MNAKARELLSKLRLYGISSADVEVEVVSNGNFVVRAYKHPADPVREAVRAIVRGRPLTELPLKTQVREFTVPASILEDELGLRRLAEEVKKWLWG